MTAPRSEPVLVQLGARPEEAVQLVGPDARASYPADVRARLRADADIVLARYPQARSALLPLLHLVQSEDGYLTPAGIEFCSDVLDLTGAEVTAVATFYSMYRREPTGDYRVGVCTNTLCAVMGGDAIMDALRDHLEIDHGETTADGSITLEHIECNAACDFAPVMMVNWEFFDNRTPASARELVDALRSGAQVTPTRGAPLCTFRDQHTLARIRRRPRNQQGTFRTHGIIFLFTPQAPLTAGSESRYPSRSPRACARTARSTSCRA